MDTTSVLKQWGFSPFAELGSGSNAKVVLAYSRGLRKTVAIKIIDMTEERDDILGKELKISSMLQHTYIVTTLRVYECPRGACIVMEPAQTNLYRHLRENGPMSESESRRLFLQLTIAVNYMHHKVKIAHRDIACSNILLNEDFNIKLADFSSCKFLEQSCNIPDRKTFFVTIEYQAPEVYRRTYDLVKADLFSMGVVLYFMLTEMFPVRNSTRGIDKEVVDQLSVSEYCHQLLGYLLHKLPRLRHDTTRILKHEWLDRQNS